MQQSDDHLRSMLWASPRARVYAFVQGDRVPGLPEQLPKAAVQGWDCLQRGALSPTEQASAAYVIELRRDAPFTDTLLRETATTFPEWGLIGVSEAPLLSVREHGRRLLNVQLPDGQSRPWRWLAPRLWGGLLPQLGPEQLNDAFGCMSDWVLIDAAQWQWLSLRAGVLSQDTRRRLAPAPT